MISFAEFLNEEKTQTYIAFLYDDKHERIDFIRFSYKKISTIVNKLDKQFRTNLDYNMHSYGKTVTVEIEDNDKNVVYKGKVVRDSKTSSHLEETN